MGLLKIFGKSKSKREGFEFPGREELDIPPAPPSVTEEPAELPNFSMREESEDISSMYEAEDEAVQMVKKGLEERGSLELTKPIFVKYKLYKAMLDEIGQLKTVLKESEDTLERLSEFEDDREKTFSKWRRDLDDIQKKLIYVDKTLFGK